MQLIKIIGLLAAVLFGVFLIIFGEQDDSPGAQGLGLILALTGAWNICIQRRKNKHHSIPTTLK